MQFDQLLQSQGLGLVQTWLGRARRLPAPVEWASGSQVTSVPEPTHILVLTGLRGRSSWRRQPPSLDSLFLAFFFGRFFSWPQVYHILQSAFIFLSTLFPQGNVLMFVLQNTIQTLLLCALESDTTKHTWRRSGRGVTTIFGFRGCFSVKNDVSGF